MKTGIYVPIPHVTGHSARLKAATVAAQKGLRMGEVDPGYELALESVLEAERLGFDIALFAERHLGPDLEAWILAAAVASHTKTIQIMPALNPDFWHPNVIAKMAATLDRIAPGRSAINFVTGWNADEARHFSSARHDDEEAKYSRAEAFIRTLRETLAASGDADLPFDSSQPFSPAAVPLVPASSAPPIYTVSRSNRGLEMVAKVADHWFVDYGSDPTRPFKDVLEQAAGSVADMKQRMARHRRSIGLCLSAFIVPAASEQEGWSRIETMRSEALKCTPHLAGPQWGAVGAQLVGPAELIRERLQAYHEIGIELALLKYIPEPDALQTIAQIVMPVAK